MHGHRMGPQPNHADEVERLAALALTGTPEARNDLYRAAAGFLCSNGDALGAGERVLVCEIIRTLATQIAERVRLALALQLATDPAAPHELVVMLANDKIEVARPVIAGSPVLTSEDLVALIREAGASHQCAVAARPGIDSTVSAVIAECAADEAVAALLGNTTATIGPKTFIRLVDRARTQTPLQAPLASRADLPRDLALRLCAAAGAELQRTIMQRFGLDPLKLNAAVDQAVIEAAGGVRPDAELAAERLVEKLHAAGQLKPAFLLKALNQGQKPLFEHAFARLLGLPVARMRDLLGQGPLIIATACRAAGIDRSVYMTIWNFLAMEMTDLRISTDERAAIDRIFASGDKDGARAKIAAA